MTTTPFATWDSHEHHPAPLEESTQTDVTGSVRETWLGSSSVTGVYPATLVTNAPRVLGLAGLAVVSAMLFTQPVPLTATHLTSNLSNRTAPAAAYEFDVARSTHALKPSDITPGAWPEQTETADGEIPPLRAVQDLKKWLSLNDGEVAGLCGFSRRTLLNWRHGSDAYGASTRKLLAVHALISTLNLRWGSSTTRLWLEVPDAGRNRRIESIAKDVDGLRRAIADVSEVLFARPSSPAPEEINAGMTDQEVSALMASSAMVNEPTPRTTARRGRKPGSAQF